MAQTTPAIKNSAQVKYEWRKQVAINSQVCILCATHAQNSPARNIYFPGKWLSQD